MPDYLLIRAQNAAAAVDALTVAAEITEKAGDDVQVDIATSEEYADYLRLSEAVRRVVGIAAPDVAELSAPTETDDGDGIGGKLLSFGKKMASVAGQNARQYWEVAKELRLVRYDAVFDFDSSAFSVAAARAAKADKIIGFDARNIEKPVAGASLLYNEVYHIKAEMSNAMRLRHLPARFFDYTIGDAVNCRLTAAAPPPDVAPYIAVVGAVPPPFAATLQELNQRLLVRTEQTDNAQDIAGVVQHAAFVVGNGVAAAIAAACGVKTIFIGGKRDMPVNAVYASTPGELSAACTAYLPSPATPPPANTTADTTADAANNAPQQNETTPPQNALLSKIKTK